MKAMMWICLGILLAGIGLYVSCLEKIDQCNEFCKARGTNRATILGFCNTESRCYCYNDRNW